MTKAYFDKLKPETRRIKIAQDVLATLKLPKSKRFQVERGNYCKIEQPDVTFKSSQQLKSLLPKVEKHCEACAMGALFLSQVRMINHLTVEQVDPTYTYSTISVNDENIISKLSNSFSRIQLREIELAFEGRTIGINAYSEEAKNSYYDWTEKFRKDETRLKAICRNIIRNKGTFIITDVK